MCVFLEIDKTRNMIGKTLICVEARWGVGRFSYTGSSSSFVYMWNFFYNRTNFFSKNMHSLFCKWLISCSTERMKLITDSVLYPQFHIHAFNQPTDKYIWLYYTILNKGLEQPWILISVGCPGTNTPQMLRDYCIVPMCYKYSFFKNESGIQFEK